MVGTPRWATFGVAYRWHKAPLSVCEPRFVKTGGFRGTQRGHARVIGRAIIAPSPMSLPCQWHAIARARAHLIGRGDPYALMWTPMAARIIAKSGQSRHACDMHHEHVHTSVEA